MADLRIGFIGLGAIGLEMAKTLVRSGLDVTGYDINPHALDALALAGGGSGLSARAVARSSDVFYT